MKNIKYPALLSAFVVIWSISCVTLFPNTAREVFTPPTVETTILPTVIPTTIISATPTPINTFSGQIVYNKGDYIHSINADGTNDTRLAMGKTPVWSPDGNTIVFLSDPEGDFEYDIFLMNSDGTNQRPLLPGQKEYVDPRDLNWQPNGSLIVFVALSLKDRDNGYDIFTIDTNSATLQKIPRKVADVWGASWSSDGKQIMFVSVEDANDTGTIYTINIDGTGEKKLTHAGSCEYPTYSPDGKLIAYAAGGIYIINADGSDRRPLLEKGWHAAWSPDGKSLAITISEEKIARLYIVNLDGSGSTYLTDGYGGDWKP